LTLVKAGSGRCGHHTDVPRDLGQERCIMLKDIVVNLGLGARDPTSDYTISVAEAFEAHVLGVAIAYEPIIPGTVFGSIPPEIIDKARAAVSRFDQAAKRAGGSVSLCAPFRIASEYRVAVTAHARSKSSAEIF
jgi:hypothetical protein